MMTSAEKLRQCLNKLGFRPHRCKVCGSEFEAKKEYAYKIPQGAGFLWFCSWHCIQAYRKEKESMPRKPKRVQTKTAAEVEPPVMEMLKQGLTNAEIARRLDISASWVSRIKKKFNQTKGDSTDGNGNRSEDGDLAPDRLQGDQV